MNTFTHLRAMESRHYQVVLWLVLLQLHTESIVHARFGCDQDPVLLQRWENAWLVSYNERPCDRNSPWYVFCEDSGWGDEEATVVCREQGSLYGTSGYLPSYQGAIGYSYIECEGTENELKKCSFGNTALPCTSYVGVVTQCYNSTEPRVYIRDNHLEVSEGELAEVCIELSGPLIESVYIALETSDIALAIANYDYIPVSYTLTFGPSYQSEQCVKIQIINDSLAEGWERLTVQLTTNSSAVNITTPQLNIYIKPNNGSDQSDICEDGSLTLSSGVDGNSLQLVEMCSEGVWSPVCDHNWTAADANVACRELGYQGIAGLGILESESVGAARVPDCKGNEAALADCFQQPKESVECHYVLVDCLNGPEGPDNEHPNITEGDDKGTDSDTEDSENGVSDNEVDSEGESEDTAASKGSSAGVTAGGIVAGIVAVVVMMVGILVVILVLWKRRMKRLPSTDKEESASSQPAVDNKVQIVEHFEITDNPVYSVGINQPAERRDGLVEDFKLTDNPVYGVGIAQAALSVTMGTPERNLVLYAPPKKSSLQGIEEPVTGQGNATLEMPCDLSGGSNGVNEYNPYENEEDCPHT